MVQQDIAPELDATAIARRQLVQAQDVVQVQPPDIGGRPGERRLLRGAALA